MSVYPTCPGLLLTVPQPAYHLYLHRTITLSVFSTAYFRDDTSHLYPGTLSGTTKYPSNPSCPQTHPLIWPMACQNNYIYPSLCNGKNCKKKKKRPGRAPQTSFSSYPFTLSCRFSVARVSFTTSPKNHLFPSSLIRMSALQPLWLLVIGA